MTVTNPHKNTADDARTDVVERILAGENIVSDANSLLANIGETESVSAATIWFRPLATAQRLAALPGHEDAKRSLASGGIIAAAFYPDKLHAMISGNEIHVSSDGGLLTTAVLHASHVLALADTAYGPTTLLLESSAISSVKRVPFIGLTDADNAFIELSATVSMDAVVGELGGGADVVDAPYRAGLTFGAVAIGGARRGLSMLRRHALEGGHDERLAIGHVAARVAASEALMQITPTFAPDASWHSRATKLVASDVALEVAALAQRLLGPSAYAAQHPLPGLTRDLEGLAFQAPTNTNAALHITNDITKGSN